MLEFLKKYIAAPGDHGPDGSLPATKLAPKAAAVGSMAMVSTVAIWAFRMIGVQVGEKQIDDVFAAGVTLFGFVNFLAAYFTKDKSAAKTK